MVFGILLQGVLTAAAPWLAAAGGALQAGVGIDQLIKAHRMRNIKRPMMTTPKEMTEYLGRRRFAAGTFGLPGQAQTEAKIGRQSAGSLQAIKQSGQTPAEMIAGISAVDQNTKESMANLGVQAAGFENQEELLYDQALQQMAQQKMKEQEYNVLRPFEDQRLAQAALYQGGMTNLGDFASNMSELFAKWGQKAV